MITPLCRASALLVAVALICNSALSQPPLPPPAKVEPKAEVPAPRPAEQPVPKPPEEPGVKVLEQGPVHEAFAQPGADVRGKGMTAPKAPPAPIPELPPDAKPDGANVKWVPGYWVWDADRKDFNWMSGFWRNVPPGREWQPGKWAAAKDGSAVYTPGFWRPADMNSWRIDLPEPPATVENGPNTPAPNQDSVWIPGAWEFRNEQYVWRPGYWARPAGDMLWNPGQYLATPRGYSYVPGYWDYPLEDRGLLYAPVCFTQPLWQNPGWAYRPRYALGVGYGNGWGTGGLFTSLYIGPGYNNYYYGNYGRPWTGGTWLGLNFGSPFWGPAFGFGGAALGPYPYAGFFPWWVTSPGFSNPLWRHYCWLNRTNPAFATGVTSAYVGRTFGVQNAPLPPVGSVAAQPAVVGGALHTAAKSAAISVAPAKPPVALVQPAAQVSNSIAAANAAKAVKAAPSLAPATGLGAGNPLHAGVRTDPVATGARGAAAMPTVVPGITRPTDAAARVPLDWTPKTGTQPLQVQPGGINPGVTAVPRNPLQIVQGSNSNPAPLVGPAHLPSANPIPSVNLNPVLRSNPAQVAPIMPSVRPSISVPPPSAMPAMRLPAQSLPSIHAPVGGGVHTGGVHVGGGHVGGGHVGGGGHGGKH